MVSTTLTHRLRWFGCPSKKPLPGGWGLKAALSGSAEADLRQNALTGQQLCAETDDEAHHGQTAVPGLSEIDEAEACVVGHGKKIGCTERNKEWSFVASICGYQILCLPIHALISFEILVGSGCGFGLKRVFGPGMLWIAASHLPSDLPVAPSPETG